MYDFSRYVSYMRREQVDAVIASNYDLTARMLDDYFHDLKLVNSGTREYNALVGCDSKGEMIRVVTPQVPPINNEVVIKPCIEPQVLQLAEALRQRGLERGTIGLEMLDLPAAALMVLQEALPKARFIDATKLIRQDMARKTEREIGLISRSVEISEQGFRNVLRHMREALGQPVSELMYRYYMPEVNRLGGCLLGSNLTSTPWQWWDGGRKPPEEGMCAVGTDEAKSGLNINTWSENGREPIVREGGIPINFDLLCYYQGLQSDIAFRAVVGDPDPAFVEIFDISILAKDALVSAMKSGMTCAQAEEACLAAMRRAVGSAWDKNYWAVHSVGHTPHEFPEIGSPYIGEKSDWTFEVGTVLSIETIAEEAYLLREDGLRRVGEMEMKIYSV